MSTYLHVILITEELHGRLVARTVAATGGITQVSDLEEVDALVGGDLAHA